ncbi:FAD-binding oxidoreductase [Pseudonocardia sp. MH-G8]|uniref:FAD-binding oxidoreductase n=1 Tax=Pseudonocardia sp. MH-G8 TaxID=1854588 RepID=UPI000BA15AD5|nr:FAD-binding protein [Pseudonocardia sp. MH-G8]OZM78449.1 dehydrogenase [Pseudonocardia sp. MH-G8]
MSQGNATASPLRPTDLRSLRDALLDTAGTVRIAGTGTAAGWAGTPAPVDTVLDTTGLTGVITHNPGDMTVSVRAGTPLRELQAELAPHGQHVAFDAARVADGATVGGLVATADAGPAALVFGSMRDLVIGVTVVLADGTVARSGGHVIKNVAGYDLAKLLHGSYGTLGVLAEVVLRLHPVPKRTATLAVACSLEEAAAQAATVLGGPYEPAALEWTSDGTLLIRLEGTEDALDARLQRLREALGPATSDERHVRRLGSDESAVRPEASAAPGPDPSDQWHVRTTRSDEGAARTGDPWERHASLVLGTSSHASLRIGLRPSLLPHLLGALPASAVTAGLGTGVATVSLPLDAVAEAHERVSAAGGTSVMRSRPPGADVPAWGPPPSAIAVLRAVKTELDPRGRLGPGRFDPWI